MDNVDFGKNELSFNRVSETKKIDSFQTFLTESFTHSEFQFVLRRGDKNAWTFTVDENNYFNVDKNNHAFQKKESSK